MSLFQKDHAYSPSLHWIKLQNFLKKQFLKFEEKKVWKKIAESHNC